MKARTKLAAVAAATALAVVGLPSQANAVVAIAVPGSFQAGYATPVTFAPVGGPLTFMTTDIQPHNVIAFEDFLPKKQAKKTEWCNRYPKKKCPIFWSATVSTGGVTEVLGLENTESGGQYTFFCSIHPNMKGTLITF